MSVEVISPKEVRLNSVRYPLIGKIRPMLTSVFPEKQVVGDYTKVSDPYVDNWVISDQRGGILVEEMDEKKHADRCYWSTLNTSYKGHLFLPRLATEITKSTHTASAYNQGLTYSDPDSGWTNEANAMDGSSATKATNANADTGKYLYIYIPAISCSKIRYYWTEESPDGVTDLEIGVYYDDAWNVVVSDDSAGEGALAEASLGATKTVTAARVKFTIGGSFDAYLHVLEFYAEAAAYVDGDYVRQITFNSNEYLAWGNALRKLDAEAGASYITIAAFPATITDIFTDGSTLYVFLGDGEQYWYATPTASSATLAEDLDASETAIDVSDGTQFASCDIIAIDSEEMLVASISTNTLTVTRGYGSTAATHDSGAAITTTRFVVTTADPAGKNATLGIHWDDKVFKMDSNGQLALLTNPATATPTSTAKGRVPVDDNDVQRLKTFYNVDGDDVIYAGTLKGVWALDYANAKWVQTELKLPNHPTGGYGLAHWRDGLYVSAGLDVMKYVPEVPAQIRSMGLDRDDGLPVEYIGEIRELIPSYNEMFAIVDATLSATGTSTSSLYAYDGKGWQCWWIGDSTEKAMNGGAIGTTHTYGIYFDHNDTIYRIPLPRTLRNPLKIATDTHGTAGAHITPWFDADWQVGNKLALRFKINVLGDVSADESVIVRYRTDHATSAIASGNFTTLGTITSSGLSTYNFASSVGLAFKAIQFRFDLARKAADTDETPDILYAVLEYIKVIPKRWGWRFTVDCSQDWHGKNSKQLIDALITAAELETLVTLVYDNTTKYVQIKSVTGERETGRTRKGQYEVFVTELF